MSSQPPQRTSLPFTPFIGAACVLAAIGIFLSGSISLAVAILCMGGTFLLLGGSAEAWTSFPLWRRLVIVALLVVGGAGLLVAFLSGFSR